MLSQAVATRAPGRRGRARALGLVALACCLLGVALLGSFAFSIFTGLGEQNRRSERWQQTLAGQRPGATLEQPDPQLMTPVNGVDFAIRVPKIGYYSAVQEGIQAGDIVNGPGHYPETPWPGQPGMVGVAAHNVYWIRFPDLANGDEIDVETRYGTYKYMVTGHKIVEPDDRTVLIPQAPGYHLTLTTCWPIWAGAFATQRYIVFTDQVSPKPAVIPTR